VAVVGVTVRAVGVSVRAVRVPVLGAGLLLKVGELDDSAKGVVDARSKDHLYKYQEAEVRTKGRFGWGGTSIVRIIASKSDTQD